MSVEKLYQQLAFDDAFDRFSEDVKKLVDDLVDAKVYNLSVSVDGMTAILEHIDRITPTEGLDRNNFILEVKSKSNRVILNKLSDFLKIPQKETDKIIYSAKNPLDQLVVIVFERQNQNPNETTNRE